MSFLKSKYAGIADGAPDPAGDRILYRRTAGREHVRRPLRWPSFPTDFGGWQMYKDVKIEQETLDVLKADDTLNRVYINPARNASTYLFIAFFKTQRVRAVAAFAEELPAGKWL